ncbi:hypothetical protein Skr01_26230 [Sphaerisporangium krabiense]|uniref:Starvation-inducible outer membrane lipoprotein n=1 Tax=Sphaerisporangium krabiense TaxID=763782 RepID=A0A7W8ZB81_9ACTN|nr:hypothetical protein [Sphaerisporangium krabiense]MBB5630508.1 starvation-inducible outer membrane lipoprotein [Sphaerisporangium krabiense]GII62538.1 hypothetical protein Skr01_26230 [Sphaerisporangium krabiense]
MLILSSPAKLRRKATVVALLVPLALTACTSDKGPTVAQAGQTLKSHILQLLKESNAQNVTIADPGGKNIPCEEGKAKQTFAAIAVDSESLSKPQIVKDGLISALSRVAPYKIVSDGFDDKPIQLENAATGTILYIGSSGHGEIDVRGQTQCLSVA